MANNWSIPVNNLLNMLQKEGFIIVAVEYFGGKDGSFDSQLSKLAVRKLAVDAITSVDQSYLYLKKAYKINDVYSQYKSASLYLVLGNDPHEIVADYSANNDIMNEIEDIVNKFSDAWAGKKCPTK